MSISDRLGEVFQNGIQTFSQHPLGEQVLTPYAEAMCDAGATLADGTPASPDAINEYLMNNPYKLHQEALVAHSHYHLQTMTAMN